MTMTITLPKNIDYTRGFDVMRGKKLVQHCASYATARKAVADYPRGYIRYWLKKEGE